MAQTVKNLPAVQETQVRSLDREDPLEKGVATHSSILAWRIPWTEEPGVLQSMGSQRVGYDWTVLKTIKMKVIRPPMTSFKMTVRAYYAISTSVYKISCILLVQWVGESVPLERCLPSQPASKIKQTFFSINLAFSLAFQLWAVGPPLSVKVVTIQGSDFWNPMRKEIMVLNVGLLCPIRSELSFPFLSKVIPMYKAARASPLTLQRVLDVLNLGSCVEPLS